MFASAQQARRQFLTSSASGLGLAALGSMLTQDGLLQQATAASRESVVNHVTSNLHHFAPKAKSCICFRPARHHIWTCSIRSPN